MCASFKRTGRITSANHPSRLGSDNHCTGTNHRTVPNSYTRTNKGLRTNPSIGTDSNRLCKKRKGNQVVVVTTSTEMDTLGYNRSFTKHHRSHAVTVDTWAEAGFRSHL